MKKCRKSVKFQRTSVLISDFSRKFNLLEVSGGQQIQISPKQLFVFCHFSLFCGDSAAQGEASLIGFEIRRNELEQAQLLTGVV